MMAAMGWVHDARRHLTREERRRLSDEFGIDSAPLVANLEVTLTRYEILRSAAATRPSGDEVRKGLARVHNAIVSLEAALRDTADIMADTWSDTFQWSAHGHEPATMVPPCDLAPLRDHLQRVEAHAWTRRERLTWTRTGGRPAKGELRWFVTTMAAIFFDANPEAPLTAADDLRQRIELLRFLRVVASFVDLSLPKNLSTYLPSRKPHRASG